MNIELAPKGCQLYDFEADYDFSNFSTVLFSFQAIYDIYSTISSFVWELLPPTSIS